MGDRAQSTGERAMSVQYRTATVAGVNVAYREAGGPASPTLLLLHGFPASSFAYRHLMTALADRFHLVAPDYPGFGNSEAPDPDEWPYTFDHLAGTVEALVDHLGLSRYGLFMHDYGAPVGFRLALRRPQAVDFLVIQNANAYEDGFTGVWDGLRRALGQPHVRDGETAPRIPRTRRGQVDLHRRHPRPRAHQPRQLEPRPRRPGEAERAADQPRPLPRLPHQPPAVPRLARVPATSPSPRP